MCWQAPKEANTNNYQSYKDAYKKKDDFSLWDQGFKDRASAILNVEAGLVEDPTRGATNWGGGIKNYNYYVEKFGKDNVITMKDGPFKHNFFNLNTGKLNSIELKKPELNSPKVPDFKKKLEKLEKELKSKSGTL